MVAFLVTWFALNMILGIYYGLTRKSLQFTPAGAVAYALFYPAMIWGTITFLGS